ncbi:MAG: DUF2760 domain-containing protein [Bradyrhizobiaceae bacterium]|nr:DUF2760 domain-containing protein [Bradyrhizobiaceae bacterium]
MRNLVIALAVILLALSVFALVPAAAPYADLLPKVIAGVAALLLIAVFVDRSKAASTAAPVKVAPVAAAPLANQADSEVVNFVAILQERGRFVDFLMDDIKGYSDAQVGAAGRVLHEGCKAVLLEHFGIRPMREEGEGSKVTVPTGYAPDDYRLVGKISGEAPFTGTLIHHGWRVEWVKLPRLLRASADRLPAIAPAEVELR